MRSVLGDDFVTNQLESIIAAKLNLSQRLQAEVSGHPMIKDWAQLCADVEKTEKNKKLSMSPSSALFLEVLYNIKHASALPNAEKMMSDIRSKGKYHSGKHEADIAIRYSELGFDVGFIQEGEEKAADIRVKAKNTEVHVECKSFRDSFLDDYPHWRYFQEVLCNELLRLKRCWVVLVDVVGTLAHTERNHVLNHIKGQINNNELKKIELFDDKISVKIDNIATPDEEMRFPGLSLYSNYNTAVKFEVRDVKSGTVFRNPVVVGVSNIFESNQAKRVLNYLKKAKNQVSKKYPAILHIDLDLDSMYNIFEVIDDCWDIVHQKLEKDFRGINAVVLTGNAISPKFPNTNYPTIRETVIIPNRFAKKKLPKDFGVLGFSEKIHEPGNFAVESELKKHGIFSFNITLKSELDTQAGTLLFVHCSRDALFQLKLWQTHKGYFRFEMFTPNLGHMIKNYDLSVVEVGKTYRLSFTWTETDLEFSIDGQRVSSL